MALDISMNYMGLVILFRIYNNIFFTIAQKAEYVKMIDEKRIENFLPVY